MKIYLFLFGKLTVSAARGEAYCPPKKNLGSVRGVPNPNNSVESEFIRKQIVSFLINRIEILNIHIRLLINQTQYLRIKFLFSTV